ncbi:hypothetical protein EXIGLDRAFT_837945 [Exidia glandulosa HHB12029]|uniref:Uncharacterized protein n=1 Tax=Exidia glandulosa HHB12029 TaxID=1314781 RepID=A0A166AAZ5_EXIGL|nr:hypothetical protein EXIGLDRAFT_837945 [Exidia glandulosa HHB12029]
MLNHFLSANPSKRRNKRKRRSSSDSDSGAASDSGSDVRAIEFEDDDNAAHSDSDESDVPRRSTRLDSSPEKKKQRLSSPPAQPVVSSPPSEPEEDSPRVSGSRKGKAVFVIDSDSDEQPVVKKKKVVRGQRPPTPDEDDEFQDGIDAKNVLDTRLRRPGKKTKFTQALERMKQRKKNGRSVPSEEEDEEDDEDDNPSDPDRPFDGAKPTEDYDEGSDDGSVKDFIIDDEGDADEVVLPSAFRMQQNLSHHFKIICQYYVHLTCAKNRAKFIKLSANGMSLLVRSTALLLMLLQTSTFQNR